MLTVYTYPIPRPSDSIDLSTLPLDQLADSALAVLFHQKSAHIWFGYLDGWMLTPHEEVRLRKVIRAFPCSVVSRFPLSFSLAWKNEIDCLQTDPGHGASHVDDHGRSVYNWSSSGHNRSCERASSDGIPD